MKHRAIFNHARVFSILLALLLQCAPVSRLVQATQTLSSPFAYVLRFIGFAASALGAVNAVSGASAVLITSPTNAVGTNGTAFRYRITENSPSTDPGVWYNAIPLPPGLTVNTNTALVTGTPTQTGVTIVHLSAGYQGQLAIPTNLTLNIFGKPVINTQPASQIVSVGTNATFAIAVTALPVPTNFWMFNGSLVGTGTNTTFTVSNVSTTNAGSYSVISSNFLGAVTSTVATLTVSSATPPSITTQPQGRTALVGSNITLSVAATGASPITFQWQKNSTNVNSATSSNLALGPLTLSDSGGYRVIVGNSSGSVTSMVAVVNVVQAPAVNGPTATSSGVSFTFMREAGAAYDVLIADAIPATTWTVLTNFPPVAVSTAASVTNLATGGTNRFYRIRMTIP